MWHVAAEHVIMAYSTQQTPVLYQFCVDGRCSSVAVSHCLVQVCIYRNSVRRAMKSIAQAVEQLEATQAGAAETADVARAVMNVVTQIAQSLHRLQLVRHALIIVTDSGHGAQCKNISTTLLMNEPHLCFGHLTP